MLDFLMTEKHLSRDDAYMLSSVAADLHITELVDGNKGVHMMLPKIHLRLAIIQMRATSLFLATLLGVRSAGNGCPCPSNGQATLMGPEAARTKMRLVVQEAVRQARNDSDKAAFQSRQVFVNLLEKDTAVVGVGIIPVAAKASAYS